MAALERLFMEIFEGTNCMVGQLESQGRSYDKALASTLLIRGIDPPPWLRSSGIDAQIARLKELKSTTLYPPTAYPRQTDANVDKTNAKALDASLVRIQRSRLRQKALELRNSRSRRSRENDVVGNTERMTKLRSSGQQSNAFQGDLAFQNSLGVTNDKNDDECHSTDELEVAKARSLVRGDDAQTTSGTHVTEIPVTPANRDRDRHGEAGNICASETELNLPVMDVPHTDCCGMSSHQKEVPEVLLSNSRLTSKMCLELQKTDFGGMKNCRRNHNDSSVETEAFSPLHVVRSFKRVMNLQKMEDLSNRSANEVAQEEESLPASKSLVRKKGTVQGSIERKLEEDCKCCQKMRNSIWLAPTSLVSKDEFDNKLAENGGISVDKSVQKKDTPNTRVRDESLPFQTLASAEDLLSKNMAFDTNYVRFSNCNNKNPEGQCHSLDDITYTFSPVNVQKDCFSDVSCLSEGAIDRHLIGKIVLEKSEEIPDNSSGQWIKEIDIMQSKESEGEDMENLQITNKTHAAPIMLPAACIMPDICHSLPNGLIEKMDLSNFLQLNIDDDEPSLVLQHIETDDAFNNLSEERSYSYTPPVGRLPLKSSGSNLNKKFRLKFGLTCFPIDEDTCIDDDDDDDDDRQLTGTDSKPTRAVSSRNRSNSSKREGLTDIISSFNISSVLVPQSGKLQDQENMDSFNTMLKYHGPQMNVNKSEDSHSCARMYNFDDKENQMCYIKGSNTKEVNDVVQGESFINKGCKPDNIVSSITSFVPPTQHKQPIVLAGKRDIKVKALEAAEAVRKLEEEKENARKVRKEAVRLERERMKQQKVIEFELKQKRGDEDRKRKEVDAATRKRRREEEHKKEKKGKVRCIHDGRKQQIECERKYQALKEEQELCCKVEAQLQRALVKKQKTLGKTKGAAKYKSTKPKARTTKSLSTNAKQVTNDDEVPQVVNNLDNLCKTKDDSPLVKKHKRDLQYEISPYRSSDDEEEDQDDEFFGKLIPQWAREKCITRSVELLHHIDPEPLFPLKRCPGINKILLHRKN